MSKDTFLDWSTTASDNTDIGGLNINEGCPAANMNNMGRTIMAQARAGVQPKLKYSTKSGDYTALAADHGTFFRFTAAATLSLTAAATVGADWSITVSATNGNVTVDPNSTETINGATTLVIPSGSAATIICSGTAFFTTLRPGYTLRRTPVIYTSSDTYTPDASVRAILVEVLGGGGGGGGASATGSVARAGSGGNAGSYAKRFIVSPDSSYAITIGAGGGSSAGDNNGSDGGTTEFGSVVSCPGGKGGASSGTATGDTIFGSTSVNTAPTGANAGSSAGAMGTPSIKISANNRVTGGGGSSPYGVGGRQISTGSAAGNSVGADGTGYGSGGGGGLSDNVAGSGSRAGGAGTSGLVIIWEYI
jgi:hypothetical protein